MFRAALQAVAGDLGPDTHPDARKVETLLVSEALLLEPSPGSHGQREVRQR